MNPVKAIQSCRLCKGSDLQDVIDLGQQYLASRFPRPGDPDTPKASLTLCMCSTCYLIQLRQEILASELYEQEYGYRSGISNTMREHLLNYKNEIESKVDLEKGDLVLDIGSNDATMLHMYSENFKRIGMDPTGKQFAEHYGPVELVPTYFTRENFQNVFGPAKCKVVSSISMFYDLPDPVQFAKDIYEILDENGIWTCEQSYLFSMLKTNSFDTICHEHLEYYALHQIVEIAKRARFKIIDVSFNSCNGGSFRIYFAKQFSDRHTECQSLVESILAQEKADEISNPQIYLDFMQRAKEQVYALNTFIEACNEKGEETWVYGASTKGNVLLQFADLGPQKIRYAVERNPSKFGKMTPTGIPIISEEQMRSAPPKNLLVLPWHFRNEIVARESEFLAKGGRILFPLPTFSVVSPQ
jgi:hypothetical protein